MEHHEETWCTVATLRCEMQKS